MKVTLYRCLKFYRSYIYQKENMITEAEIKVGIQVQQLNGTRKIRTIVPNLKLPLNENPGQKLPTALEVMEQTVRLNPHMFQLIS